MTLIQNSPPRGVFFGTRRPLVFYICGGGEGIRYVIESNGGVITDSMPAAQIVIFNRDITPEILWPISVEERKVFEVVQRLGGVQPVLSSLWIYRSCRKNKLLERSEYTIQIGVYQIIPPSTIAVSTTPIPTVSAGSRPTTSATTALSIPSTPGQHQPLVLSPPPEASHTLPAPPVQTELGVVPIVYPPALPQPITRERQTNNSISSTLIGARSSQQIVAPQTIRPLSGAASHEITTEQAHSILADELYRFAHKRKQVTENDLKVFLKDLESKRKERYWQRFYPRHHERIDTILTEKGLNPKGWHNYPTKAVKDKVSKSGMKGWAWVVEPVDPIVEPRSQP
ncbi:hypothetical protein L486_01123 [Kwoniella mangroviensis CBS 10435]|uniref:BRCT domain-containing protein n=1 Tax=Kwoniella mangroviensis CBS 10435 TaxID=1331196 RepID=A0A1B9J112_9TREE|nr:hypothetical protein L486_01123 [Kwoniella mangroviensis CBS 10435]